MKTEEQLVKETEKWLRRLEVELEVAKTSDRKGDEFLENIKAYTSDTKHFLSKKDFVRAFEAVIWAWSILSLAKDLELIEISNSN